MTSKKEWEKKKKKRLKGKVFRPNVYSPPLKFKICFRQAEKELDGLFGLVKSPKPMLCFEQPMNGSIPLL